MFGMFVWDMFGCDCFFYDFFLYVILAENVRGYSLAQVMCLDDEITRNIVSHVSIATHCNTLQYTAAHCNILALCVSTTKLPAIS